MNQLHDLLLYHFKKYPQMQIPDFFKLLYQNEFSCGHMISDSGESVRMISEEAVGLPQIALEHETVEPIGNGLCRLYLSVLQNGLTAETLNRFFTVTANLPRGTAGGFEEKAAVFTSLCENGRLPFDPAETMQMLKEYRAAGYPAMRHSPQYRQAYSPAYRVVEKVFCDFLPLFCRIDALKKQKNRVICAIDGGCASGKTTLAALLASVYGCNVFSMDDFFLQPVQRTPERLAEPGGNVDCERFAEEVLKPLLAGCPFAYRPYDCAAQTLAGEVTVQPHSIAIVEGVYSLHPHLAGAYDLKVFLETDAEEQKNRLIRRSKDMYNRFIQEWIPMENKYFNIFQIKAQCELIFKV